VSWPDLKALPAVERHVDCSGRCAESRSAKKRVGTDCRDQDDLGRGREQFSCTSTRCLHSSTLLDPRVAPTYRTQSRQLLHECGNTASKFGIALGQPHQRIDPPHSVGLLRPRRERPRTRRDKNVDSSRRCIDGPLSRSDLMKSGAGGCRSTSRTCRRVTFPSGLDSKCSLRARSRPWVTRISLAAGETRPGLSSRPASGWENADQRTAYKFL
jgi:hypothetical protein